MSENDAIIRFGADVSELQAAIDQVQKSVNGVVSEKGGVGGKSGQKEEKERAEYDPSGEKNEITDSERAIKRLKADFADLNKVVGNSAFNLAHAAIQGGKAFSAAQNKC